MNDERLAALVLRHGLVDAAELAACLAGQREAEQAGRPPVPLAQLLIQRDLLSGSVLSDLLLEKTTPRAAGGAALEGWSRLGRYELIEETARGGMAVVYRAHDPALGRDVALKVLRPDVDEAMVTRLYREAAVAAQLRHPHIIAIHEVGQVADPDTGEPVHFIAMDYVEGRTLALAMHEMNLPRKLRVLERVADAIGHAHDRGLVHRDLKPLNILITGDGRPIVTDFGLARWSEYATRLTKSGVVIGTYHYMAPEQVRGKIAEIDARTDVWALGVMLYELLAGKRPYEARTPGKIYDQILKAPPPPLPDDTPAGLRELCLQALCKEKAGRPATGRALAEALRRWRAGQTPPAPRSHRALWTGLAAAALLAALALPGARRPQPPATVRPAPAPPAAAGPDLAAQLARRVEAVQANLYRAGSDPLPGLRELEPLLERLHAVAPRHDLLLGRGWLLVGRLDRAEAALARAKAPALLGRIHLRRCQLALAAGRLPQARALAAQARSELQRASEPGLASACAALEGPVTKLRAACRSLLQQAPDRPGAEEAWMLLGWTNPPESTSRLECWQRALQVKPHDALLHFLCARHLFQFGQLAASERSAKRAIALDPYLAAAHRLRGVLHFKRGAIDAAIADYGRAIALDPREHLSLLERGVLFARQGAQARALADLNTAIRLAPRDPRAYLRRALLRLSTTDQDGALRDLDQAIAVEPHDASPYFHRAELHRRHHRFPQALADYRRAIALKKDYWQALARCGSLLVGLRRTAEGLPLLRQAHALAPALQKEQIARLMRQAGAK